MKVLSNEPLSRHTSMRVGGPAETMYVPQSEGELIRAYSEAMERGLPVAMLGRGSNSIFRDEGYHGVVIKATRACKTIRIREVNRRTFRKTHLVTVGASVPNQSFLRFCIRNHLAGPTFLQSIPGNIGGSIYMNAGTGRSRGKAISDSLKEVRAFDGDKIITLSKEACEFQYRHSLFQRRQLLILEALFELKRKSAKKVAREVKDRMEFAQQWQDLSYPNAGSVFNADFRNIGCLRGKRVGSAMFSEKSDNWIINLGGASASDVLSLVDWAKDMHEERGFQRPRLECIVK